MWLDYDDKYAVSEDGLVMHKETKWITKGSKKQDGYMGHIRQDQMKRIYRFVHRMVAERFLPKIDDTDLEVDHINRDKTDNRASNLRWVTRSVNDRNRADKPIKSGHKYIHQTKSNTWHLRIRLEGSCYRKNFNTLEEAITARNKILQDYIPPV